MLWYLLPAYVINLMLLVLQSNNHSNQRHFNFRLRIKSKSRTINLEDIRKGISIMGASGSGKTESVVYQILKGLTAANYCGVIHDYKNFELTELVYPLIKSTDIPFHIVSFDVPYQRVNPIAPKYLPDEESVHELSRVLVENLLEHKESTSSNSTRFFSDVVEGLLSGLIWKLRCDYPRYCTLPHLIAIYQLLDSESLMAFLSSNPISKAMASAFIQGKDSPRQTAGVTSTLANALKKISTKRIFYTLSADEITLSINNPKTPGVVSLVNNPKYETTYAPVIACILHTITKQMSERHRLPSYVLMEEASTLRLLNMQRIAATLRSYQIATIYVLQDKIQNDLLYGEKAGRAILANLSYQFFGKVNDPDTAKYYERFFELIKSHSKSISTGSWMSKSPTRITKSEKEVVKIRSQQFFRLKPGQFVVFSDGKERLVQFPYRKPLKGLPRAKQQLNQQELERHFQNIQKQARSIFGIS
ncbi:type IV secretion system DNA-binding domain-containing protein [Zhouia spongiae]|uniref:Type IV secretion system DNA-binding domain-containing protein n=1 Tax=Zhouia spongiae TaxID=2202721 RepID=A0ABY3YKF8_9FLAO|nr:type IV secretion system DNA-binding domain-containing protein [Zhouia spongiae]UNY98325.1 type IV secretion system DNA-binding domain-containing protein [Zhouia spongiae]